MAGKGDGTMGKGMCSDKLSFLSCLGEENTGQGVGREPLETRGGSLGTCHPSPTKERAGGGLMSCSTQLPEDGCSGQSDQEVAMSLLIPACLLHTLPKEVPSARGALTISPYSFKLFVPQPRRNTSCPAPFPLHQQCHKSHPTAQESSRQARGSCKPASLPSHKPPRSQAVSAEHPDPPKEEGECRPQVRITQGMSAPGCPTDAPLSAFPGMLLRSWEKQEGKQ